VRTDWGPLDRLVERADALAASLAPGARATTSLGQERAMLRLFGVTGLDATGRPLAGATVDRWLARDRRGLGGGIALPFAMGLLEYDLDPQQLALDVAAGSVDLGLESDLLRLPDRRAVAEAEAVRLAKAAVDRIDADRTARREIIDLLGDATPPWIGTTIVEPDLDGALDEVDELIAAGADLIRIEVPIGRELAERLQGVGLEVPEWRPGDTRATRGREPVEPAPAGSQRALAELRRLADSLAAQRRGYVRLATAAPALWSPEDAVVAAFERIDLVEADPMAEIVATGVDPDRALSDHAFAHRLHRRAGTIILVGAGSLVVAPDLRVGIPSDPATRCGRALALQVLAIALAKADGVPASQIAVGALPTWMVDEPAAASRSVAEIAIRRELYPEHPLAFIEPDTSPDHAAAWPFMLAAGLSVAGEAAIVIRRPGRTQAVARETRAAARVAAEVGAAHEHAELAGVALEHARGAVGVAMATIEMLGDRGWRAVAGDGPGVVTSRALGREAVAERTESFDPLEVALGRG
jgi:beta-lysine 5,6-aminomutase alpha subunit